VRNDVRAKERIGDFRNLVQEIMDNLERRSASVCARVPASFN
jgi:hypothetical protein